MSAIDSSPISLIEAASKSFYILNVNQNKIEFGKHQHQRAQLIYAEGGIVDVFIDDQHYYLPARCFMLIPCHVNHAVLGHGHNVEMYNIYFPKIANNSHPFFEEFSIYFATDLIREMIHFTKNYAGEIPKESSAYYFLQGFCSVLTKQNAHQLPYKVSIPYPKDPKLMAIANFLQENLEKSLGIEEVAKQFGLSERTLSRKFREELGTNYVKFLRTLRMTKALEMISENKYNMYEIALHVGYSSLSSFSNIFHKIMHMRPTEYLAQIKDE